MRISDWGSDVCSSDLHLNVIHPSLTCAVDGDAAGNDYIATCCGLQAPPAAIVRWPDGWAIENVIGWIVEADVAILQNGDLEAAGVPQNAVDFVTSLSGPMKKDEILHGLRSEERRVGKECVRTCSIRRSPYC